MGPYQMGAYYVKEYYHAASWNTLNKFVAYYQLSVEFIHMS